MSSKGEWLQSCQHVMNTSVIGSCPEHIICHWFTVVIFVICKTLNKSWAHQSLVHHCHISHFQNFEHVMNTSVIGSPLSYQSFTELWTCHEHISHWVTIAMSVIYRILNMSCQSRTKLFFLRTLIYRQTLLYYLHISHEQNTIPRYELSSHADVISYHHLKDTTTIWKPMFLRHNPWLVTNCQSSNYAVIATYQDTFRFIIITRCRVIYRSSILSENYSIIACYIQVRTIELTPYNIIRRWQDLANRLI